MMNWRNSSTRYGWLAAALHLLMLLLLVAVFCAMELRGYFPKGSAGRAVMKSWHLIGLHATAALYHHCLMRDNTLRRMLPK